MARDESLSCSSWLCCLRSQPREAADLRLGIVGTDTSHVGRLHQDVERSCGARITFPGAKIVAAYKGGSPDIESSRTRIDKFTQELQDKWGIQIVDSIPELCKLVDAVLLESVDGRVHLAQAREVIRGAQAAVHR